MALKEFARQEISAYGCVLPEAVDDGLVRILDIVEKPKPEDAPSNLAVMGRYVFTPEIFDALERVQPGAGGEIQLTDAIGLLLKEQTVYGFLFEDGRYDIGDKLDYLRATVEIAIDREDLGPEFRDLPGRAGAAEEARLSADPDPLEDARGPGPRRLRPAAARPMPLADALGRVLAEPVVSGEDVPPVRQHGDGRLRGAGGRHRRRPGAAARWSAPGRGRRPGRSPVGPGQAVRIMTGAPMPAGRRRRRDGRADRRPTATAS